jgi:hypothetical protein
MKTRRILDEPVGDFRIKLESIENDLDVHDYGIPRQAWLRGVKFMQHFGAERALDIIDQRAERAASRGDYDTARRWRGLITAIHAVQEDEHLPGDNTH